MEKQSSSTKTTFNLFEQKHRLSNEEYIQMLESIVFEKEDYSGNGHDWLATINKTSLDAIIVFDTKYWKIDYCNDKFLNITGFTLDEVKSEIDFIKTIVFPDDASLAEAHFQKLIKPDFLDVENIELRIRKKTGEVLWVYFRDQVIKYTERGEPYKVLTFLSDITEKKAAEIALAENEKKYRQLAENASDLIWTTNLEGIITYISPSVFNLLGYTVEESIHRSCFDFMTEESKMKATSLSKLFEYSKSQKMPSVELEYLSKIGETKLFDVALTVLFNAEGKPTEIHGISRNISDKKIIEQKLLESEEKYRSLVERANDGIGIIKNGILTYANNKLVEMWGGKKEEAIGRPFSDFIHESALDKVKEIYSKRIKGEKVPNMYETRMKRKDEEVIEIELNAGLINFEGELADLIILRDITKRKLDEKVLDQARKDWEDIFEAIGQPAIIMDKEHRLIAANKAVERVTGESFEQLKNKRCFDIFQCSGGNKGNCPLERLLDSGKAETVEMEMSALGGTYLVSCTPVLEENNQIKRIIHIATDITARKKTEQALAESEQRFSQALKGADLGLWDWNIQEDKVTINERWAEIVGYTVNELNLTSISWFKMIHPDDRSFIQDVLGAHLNGETEVYDVEFRMKSKSGQYKWILARGKIMEVDLGKKPVRMVGTHLDISERKKTSEELEANRIMLQNVLDTIPLRVFWKDLKSNYLGCNERFAQDAGYEDASEIISKDDSVMPWKKASNYLKEEDAAIIKSGIPKLNYEGKLTLANKKTIIKVTNKLPLKRTNGEIYGLLGIYEDITESAKTKKELENTVANLQAMIENTDDFIMIADKKGSPLFYNTNYKNMVSQMFGIEMKPGLIPHSLISDNEQVKQWDEIHKRVLNGEKFSIQIEWPFDGNPNFFEFSFYPVIENGDVVGFAEHSRNITLAKEHEIELRNAKEKAEESDRLKSAFLANMSHEIRTPMNGIIGFAELLEEPDNDEAKRQRYIEVIKKRSADLLNIINDILDISKIEAGQVEMKTEEFSLNKMLSNLLLFYGQKKIADRKEHIDFVVRNELTTEAFKIKSDESRIRQILTNLIDNAFKFTEKGTIEIGYTFEKDKLHFFVRDTGIGIAKDKHQAIFDRFIQDDISTTRKYGGTGLGLAICKGLVDLLGGEMRLESELGKGSTFSFSVKYELVYTADADVVSDVVIKKKGDWNNKTILLFEDDITTHEYFSELMAPTGINLLIAEYGNQGLELLYKNNIDLVLLDINLPDKNGLDIARTIRKTNKEIPIIAQTAFAMHDDRSKAILAGCNEYLPKPINSEVLFELLTLYLKS